MTPAARCAAAIVVLDGALGDAASAERAFSAWAKGSRYAGSKDRAAVRDIVFDGLRRRRSLGWRLGGDDGRAIVLGALADQGMDAAEIDAFLASSPHGPAPLSAAEIARLATPEPPSESVALDAPDALEAPLRAALGARFAEVMRAAQMRAPVDLRINPLKCSREEAQARLEAAGIAAEPLGISPFALRAPPGAPVGRTDLLTSGCAEPQDAASQAGARLAEAQPGETVLDFCAGGGGKTLALGADMGGEGHLIAHDAAYRRMRDLPVRAARAGLSVDVRGPGAIGDLEGRCDLVFVDAPCSGSGAWRRDPGAKWAVDAARLAALGAAQDAVLAEAAPFARPGGRLVYATCSMLREENDARVARFAEAHGFAIDPARRLSVAIGEIGDGFFTQVLIRK